MISPDKENSSHGGFLEGKIEIPGYSGEDLYMRLSCVADDALSYEIKAQLVRDQVLERDLARKFSLVGSISGVQTLVFKFEKVHVKCSLTARCANTPNISF